MNKIVYTHNNRTLFLIYYYVFFMVRMQTDGGITHKNKRCVVNSIDDMSHWDLEKILFDNLTLLKIIQIWICSNMKQTDAYFENENIKLN